MEKELTGSLIRQFIDQLDQLIEEIKMYEHEGDLWKVPEGISNSGGNLSVHLIGNLNHFIGHGLGNTGYVRQRELEFSTKGIPSDQLIAQIQTTQQMISVVLSRLDKDKLMANYPIISAERSTIYFLIYLNKHLAYHLGQINYHRRCISNQPDKQTSE